jgi:methionine-rich copper-binding protein CopC
MKHIITAALLSLSISGAMAHSKVNKTTPNNGDVLKVAPANLDLTFAKKIRITKISVLFGTAPNVDLDLGNQTSFTKAITVPLDHEGIGVYQIKWRGLSTDGHAMAGSFSFEVKP